MDLQVDELNDLEDRVGDALVRINELQAGTGVSSGSFFPQPFMRDHTEFESFAAFRERSPWSISEPSELQDVPRGELNDYVAATTEFETWEGMRTQAAEEEIIDQIAP